MKKIAPIIFLLTIFLGSCEKILSEKPDGAIVTISTAEDMRAILDYIYTTNYGYIAGIGEVASDNIFIPDGNFSSLYLESDRAMYYWRREPVDNYYWSSSYGRLLAMNGILDRIDGVAMDSETYAGIKGTALFFRAYTYFDLAQIFSVAYDPNTANEQLGPVVRNSADVNDVSFRPSLQAVYDLILKDLDEAVQLLPATRPIYPTRPDRTAAHGLLSRVYLSMGDHGQAYAAADAALTDYAELMDYNDYSNFTVAYPFEQFNKEVVLFNVHLAENITRESIARIDTILYEAYKDNDLRKRLFFTKQNDGYHAFTGDYSRNTNALKFNGITTAELLLTRAECLARLGRAEEALSDLNYFCQFRYVRDSFEPYTYSGDQFLLQDILDERRKELVFRGLRWIDIRRIGPADFHQIERKLNGENYVISHDEIRNFAFMIPEIVLSRTGLPQN